MLKLADHLSLPLDAVTRRLAILAMSGAGKSNVAVVMAEAMFDAGIPWVVIDPKGDWWGVRSNKSGKGPGLSVPIFGGLHGDVPLEPSAGKMIADLIVDQRLTCVLDVSEFEERQGLWGFLIDLGQTLLRRNRQPLHLFLEEADEYLPQRTREKGNLPKCLGIWQRVVKRGRFRGIGTTQITQRNASLNKDTLYMAEALLALRATGKGDRDAIKGWVEHHNAAPEIVASLPSLADGEGWISSPAWLRQTKRVKFDRRRTFDSGATPVMLDSNAKPATLADVDLDALRTRMASTIERAKADDPQLLKNQIRLLEIELSKPTLAQAEKIQALERRIRELEHAPVEVPVIGLEDWRRLETLNLQLVEHGNKALEAAAEIDAKIKSVAFAVSQFKPIVPEKRPIVSQKPHSAPRNGGGVSSRPVLATSREPAKWDETLEDLDGVSLRVLRAVQSLRDRNLPINRAAIARWMGIHPNGGRFHGAIKSLREKGQLDADLHPTANTPAVSPIATDGHEGVLDLLDQGKKRIFEEILQHAGGLSREELAEQLGVHPNGGRFNSNLKWLRDMGVIPESGPIKAVEGVFR